MLDNLKSKKFWECALARSLRTLLQSFVATIGTTTMINQVDWKVVAFTSILTAIISLAMSIIAGIPESKEGE